jgi:glycosyltransferase involved in cell wall biosynthesis
MPERVIYIVRSWPRLSQTFIVNEVLALERRGVELAVFSLVRSGEDLVQPQVFDVRAPVDYLEDERKRPWASRTRLHLIWFMRAPLRSAMVFWFCLRHPGLAAGYGDCSTRACFLHAMRVAAALDDMRAVGEEPVHVHAHFAHDPALVGMLVARLTGLPFSFTAHARDLVQVPATSLAARAAEATALVTCCAANAEYIASAVPPAVRPPVLVIHHGVELGRFVPAPRGGSVAVPSLVSVGRLVEKKGYVDLLHALGALKANGARFICRIYGDGPLCDELTELRDSLDLRDHVELMGAQSNEQILAALHGAHAFVLAPRVAEGGDRDGIPNVLVEAMACGLPVATTTAGGITELVQHDVNGLVSEPGDVVAMAESISRLLTDHALRRRLGDAARCTVERDYDVDVAARRLERVLRSRSTRVRVMSR